MAEKRNRMQRRWRTAALAVLLRDAGGYDRGPWIPAGEAVKAIRDEANCTMQAASGSLRALLTVGLVDRCETQEGTFWKATDAATSAYDLLIEPFRAEIGAISERLEGIEGPEQTESRFESIA